MPTNSHYRALTTRNRHRNGAGIGIALGGIRLFWNHGFWSLVRRKRQLAVTVSLPRTLRLCGLNIAFESGGFMLNLFQRYVVVSIAASLLGCAAVPVSSSDADRRLSDALDQALPALVSSGDYRSASKLSFQLATARSRMNEATAACSALSQSLAYYRTALSKETGEPVYAAASNGGTQDDGMQEIRARFGCIVAQFG